MRRYLFRHQSPGQFRSVSLAGAGGAVAIGVLGSLTYYTGQPLLMAPFGASCVLLFSVPNSPLSQPVNVVGGHLLATLVGLLVRLYLPDTWWAAALAVGLAILLMGALRMTHPPAGADPIVVLATHPGLDFLIMPVLIGSVALVVIASLFHAGSGTTYPLRKDA
jgi:CBS-domain-containing membrane protein